MTFHFKSPRIPSIHPKEILRSPSYPSIINPLNFWIISFHKTPSKKSKKHFHVCQRSSHLFLLALYSVHFFYKIFIYKTHSSIHIAYRINKKNSWHAMEAREKKLCTFFLASFDENKEEREKKLLFATFGKGARKKVSKHVALWII